MSEHPSAASNTATRVTRHSRHPLSRGLLCKTSTSKTIATSGFQAALDCAKFVVGWRSAPDHDGGAYSAPPDLLAGLRGPYF